MILTVFDETTMRITVGTWTLRSSPDGPGGAALDRPSLVPGIRIEVPVMRVLVTAASKHGGTIGIAEAIVAALGTASLEADIRPIDEVMSLEPYDAVVLGSAVYMGRWLGPARAFVERNGLGLATRPVWLFSSGPLGDPSKPVETPGEVAGLIETTHARDHRIFSGVLDKGSLGLGERAMVAAVRAPAGDFRAWDEIQTWAVGIAHTLGADA